MNRRDATTRVAVGVSADVQALARALYETEPGTNGYPPLHESILWDDLTWRDTYYDRAHQIVQKIEAAR